VQPIDTATGKHTPQAGDPPWVDWRGGSQREIRCRCKCTRECV